VSDVNANINISIDSSQALGQLRALQSQISAFNQSVIAGNAAAVQSQRALNSNLAAQIGATKAFSTSIGNIESSVSRLGTAIDKNKLSLGQYFRYGIASSNTFGKSMREHAEIMELAGDRVKRLQTQYVALGQAQNGFTRAMAVRPLQLHNADAAVGIQRQQIFNKLMHDGSTSMVNWGKNTQWAGRQLMVGFTVPLTIFGGIAGKIFMDLEKQVVQFKRVYGDLQTPTSEKSAMVEEVKGLAKEFTKYGIAVSDTIALAAKAAATGATGDDLLAQTTEATRLATLGQIDYQQALDATISLQTAFGISSKDLANTTDFLNAVENQTVTSLDDITQAIPLVAPVIKGLGGDVRDLAIFMTAMREGGVSANEGANALKSGLASLINPTKAAREQLEKVGINIDSILSTNKGDLRGLVTEFGEALGTLDKFERQQTLAKMFGKYQFARLGALFNNISKEGTQASRVIDLTGESAKNLAKIAEGELGQLEEAVGVKFTAAVEKLKLAIAPIGESFLKIATPLIEFATMLADKFNNLPDGMKSFITWGVAIGGVVIPAVVMIIGLFANFLGQMVKMGNTIRMMFGRTRGLGSALQYLSGEELDAMAASASLEGQTNSLTGALNVQRSAVNNLARSYGAYTGAAAAAASALPQGFRGAPRGVRKMATGGFVAGSGNKDSEPALLMPGEFVVNKKAAQKNAELLQAMNQGTLKGYAQGSTGTHRTHLTSAIPTSATEALAGKLAPYARNILNVVQQVETALGRTVSSIQKVSNMFVEMPAKFNNDMKAGISSERFGQDFGDAGIDKYRSTVGFVKGDFDQLSPHLQLLDKEIIAAAQEVGQVSDANIGDITKKAFAKLPAESRKMLAEVEALGTQYHGLRISVQDLTNISEAEAAKLKAAGISVNPGADKNRQYISTGDSSASTRIKQESLSQGRSYRRAKLLGLPALAAGKMRNYVLGGSADGAGTNSPSKITQQQGKDVAKGMEIGIEQGTPAAVAAAEKMGAQVAAAADPTTTSSGRQRRGASRPQGPSNTYLNGVRVTPQPQNATGNGLTGRFGRKTMPATNDPDLPINPKTTIRNVYDG
jgi:TP901 family phage tail tape measure protein